MSLLISVINLTHLIFRLLVPFFFSLHILYGVCSLVVTEGLNHLAFGSSWAVYTPCWAVQKYFSFEVLGGAAKSKTWNGVAASSL